MSRYEQEKRIIKESGSPLGKHSLNQKMINGCKNEPEPSKKVINAERKRRRRFVQALGKIRGIFQGTLNLSDSPVSKKDLHYLGGALTVLDPESGRKSTPEEVLGILHTIGCAAKLLYMDESTIGTVGHVLLRSPRHKVVINDLVCQDAGDSIDYLREQGINIEIVSLKAF